MATRNHYTTTPGYGITNRQPVQRPAQNVGYRQQQPARTAPPPPRRPTAAVPAKDSGDTVVLTLLLIVAPLSFILGVFVPFFLWVFMGVALVALITMWVMRYFTQGWRTGFSIGLVGFMVVAFMFLPDVKASPQQYGVLGAGDTQTGGEDGSGLAGGESTPDDSGTNANSNSNNNIAALLAMGASATETPTDSGDETQGDQTGLAGIPESVDPTSPAMNPAQSEAQKVLTAYLELWKTGSYEAMVQYTTPSWRNSIDMPQAQLFYNHDSMALISWQITAENQAVNADSAAFIVIANLEQKKAGRPAATMKYNVLMFLVDGKWLIDPDSIASGTAVVQATPYVAGQPTPEPTATPVPTIDPKMKLYWNSTGGKYYHADAKCSTIDPSYYSKMKEITYADLTKTAYKDKLPCTKCGAPSR